MVADLLVLARVRPTTEADDVSHSIAVTDGTISALGDDAEAQRGPGTTVVDLTDAIGDAATVLPAWGDGHVHTLWGGREMAQAPIRDCASVDEVVRAVRTFADQNPADAWVLGGSYDPSLAPNGLFDRAWLDAAVPDRPVALTASDHHCAWVNSAALRAAGVDDSTLDPDDGYLARRPDGSLLGTLVEWQAMDLVLRHAPRPSAHDDLVALGRATAALASEGLVWAMDAAVSSDMVDTYLAAAHAGALSVRTDLALRADPSSWRDELAGMVEHRRKVQAETPYDDAGDPWVTARTVKFFADGILEAGTAALLDAYTDAPHTCGLPVWSPAQLAEAVVAVDAAGFEVHVHAIGDAGVRAALDAVAAAVTADPRRPRRPTIAHTQLVHPDDLPRFAALGVVANFEPLWACLDPCQTDLTIPRIGQRRASMQYPMESIRATGAVLSFGSDWPVTSYRPLDGLATATTRRTASGEPPEGWLPAQRLGPAAALDAYATGTAWQAGEESRRGRLEVGMRADLVALDRDPWMVDPHEWRDLRVVGTWLAGRRTSG